jgi:hypothetical protein
MTTLFRRLRRPVAGRAAEVAMGRIGACRSKLGGGCRAHSGLGLIGVALLLSLSLGACGSSKTSSTSATNVVPVTGTVAGNGYGYWLQRSMQSLFSSRTLNMCDTLTLNGQLVGFFPFSPTGGTYYATCSEPAGRPLYVPEAWNECSTFAGDHSTGTSDQQLMLCARNLSETEGETAKLGWKAVKMSATVDGKPVNLWKLLAASGVYPVQPTADNILGFPPRSGRSAAYGAGLLLTGLAKGTHVIHSVFAFGLAAVTSNTWDITLTVHVH